MPADRLEAIAERTALTDYGDGAARNERAPRTIVFKPATLMLSYGEKVPVVVKNMSSTGLRIELHRNVALGESVRIVEPTLALRCWAQVIWEREGAAGLRFLWRRHIDAGSR